jgi:hypothetical protein
MADISDKALDSIEKEIEATLAAINAKIGRLVGKLETREDDTLAKMELSRMRSTRKAIIKEFAAFDEVANQSTKFNQVGKAVKSRIKPVSFSFTDSDNALLKLLSNSAYNELSGLTSQYSESVSMSVIRGSIVGASVDDIIMEATQLLAGGTDLAGRSMASHAKTIVNTRYMEADATMTLQAAEAIGAENFRYSGSLIKDSREWCIDHVDQIYTKEEVEEWANQSWAGKKEGNPFITRGGYNCRHYFVPVIDGES